MQSNKALPDYLRPGLDLVFVGINPGETSARMGHYYARAGNLFWPALNQSGLLTEKLEATDDHRLPEFGIGITDLVGRASTSEADLSLAEKIEGRAPLEEKLMRYAPRIVCFNGLGLYRVFSGSGACTPGPQPSRIGASLVFVVPSTSGIAAGYSRARKLEYFRELAGLVTSVRFKVAS